jgi:plastocyanin
VRRAIPFAILAACLVIGVLPALAADQNVVIRDFSYTPAKVAVMPGETVHWAAFDGGTSYMHSVHFDDQAAGLAAPSYTFTAARTFDQEGTFTYHCDVHPTLMKGTVYVNSTGTVPTPSPTPSPSPSPTTSSEPTTSPSPSPGGGGSGSGGGASATVTSFRVKATARKRRVILTLTLGATERVPVTATLRRGAKRIRKVTLSVRPGKHTLRLPGKKLKPGRYSLTLKAGDLKRVVRFRVRA